MAFPAEPDQALGIDWVGCPQHATAHCGTWVRGREGEKEREREGGREREREKERERERERERESEREIER